MEVSQTSPVKNIFQRMIEVQKQVTSVYKAATIQVSKTAKAYKAVNHDDVARLLHLPLAEAGIVLLPTVVESIASVQEVKDFNGNEKKQYRTDLKINVKWINADNPTDFFESNGGAFALDSQDKSYAKAYSLALKIVLLKVHLIESNDDEEQRDTTDASTDVQGPAQPTGTPKERIGGNKEAPKPGPRIQENNDFGFFPEDHGQNFPPEEIPPLKISKSDAANFKINIQGSSYNGRALRDITPKNLRDLADWLRKAKPREQGVPEFLDHVAVFLGIDR